MAAAPSLAGIQPGDALPEIVFPLTVTRIVATAIATRDYQPVHHDLERARALGSEHVFVNTHTTAGLLERMVFEWAGPDAAVKRVAFRLGTPNYAGDSMTLSGHVETVDTQAGLVTVAVKGVNEHGTHVEGTVDVLFP